jgi:hypothetical protein
LTDFKFVLAHPTAPPSSATPTPSAKAD